MLQKIKEEWLERIKDMNKQDAINWVKDRIFAIDMIDFQTQEDRLDNQALNQILKELNV